MSRCETGFTFAYSADVNEVHDEGLPNSANAPHHKYPYVHRLGHCSRFVGELRQEPALSHVRASVPSRRLHRRGGHQSNSVAALRGSSDQYSPRSYVKLAEIICEARRDHMRSSTRSRVKFSDIMCDIFQDRMRNSPRST